MLTNVASAVLFPLLLAGGLFVPGWLLGRALGAPGGPAGALLGSAALLLNLILLLDVFSLPLDATHLAAGIALVCGALAALTKARSGSAQPCVPVGAKSWRWERHHWLLAPAAVGLAALAIRASVEPLSGWDTPFRWDFLAQEMVRTGSLKFYPAVTAEDFLHYGWCDGIAPLVASLYAWTYLSLGQIAAWATTPLVLAQGFLLFHLVWQLANRRHGPAAAAAACGLLATSAAFLWGVAIGQETGLTALSLVAMFWFLEKHHAAPGKNWLAWAGVAAGTGALAREYGLIFPFLGGLWLLARPNSRRDWLVFTGACAAVALPWYLRNWLKTGNPLFCHEIGGLFPTNPVQDEYHRVLVEYNGLTHKSASALARLFKFAAYYAIGPLVLGALAGGLHWRRHGAWLAAIFAVIVLWLWSVGQTSGGTVYSLRVLTPAIALGAVLGGGLLARLAAARHGWILTLVLTILAVDAGVRSLFLPFGTGAVWQQTGLMAWREPIQANNLWRSSLNWQVITEAAEGRKILVSDPLIHAFLLGRGEHPVPLFSPEVRFLFEAAGDFKGNQARLRAAGFRFVLITQHNLINDTQLAKHSFFCELAATTPVITSPIYFLYDLYPTERTTR